MSPHDVQFAGRHVAIRGYGTGVSVNLVLQEAWTSSPKCLNIRYHNFLAIRFENESHLCIPRVPRAAEIFEDCYLLPYQNIDPPLSLGAFSRIGRIAWGGCCGLPAHDKSPKTAGSITCTFSSTTTEQSEISKTTKHATTREELVLEVWKN